MWCDPKEGSLNQQEKFIFMIENVIPIFFKYCRGMKTLDIHLKIIFVNVKQP